MRKCKHLGPNTHSYDMDTNSGTRFDTVTCGCCRQLTTKHDIRGNTEYGTESTVMIHVSYKLYTKSDQAWCQHPPSATYWRTL
jgi:hypothetical protein